jgi:hypothetical protein
MEPANNDDDDDDVGNGNAAADEEDLTLIRPIMERRPLDEIRAIVDEHPHLVRVRYNCWVTTWSE